MIRSGWIWSAGAVCCLAVVGCSTEASDSGAASEALGESEHRLIGCAKMQMPNYPNGFPGWGLTWSRAGELTFHDARAGKANVVYQLVKARFYPSSGRARRYWRLDLDLKDPRWPDEAPNNILVQMPLTEADSGLSVKYDWQFNGNNQLVATGSDCASGQSASLAEIGAFLRANESIVAPDELAYTDESFAFEEGPIWGTTAPPGQPNHSVAWFSGGKALFFDFDRSLPEVVRDAQDTPSLPVADATFEERDDEFSFKFVSVLSDRRYFGHVTVTDHGRASELSLYEGPLEGSSADRELAAHPADKVTTTRSTEFGFESKIAKDFVAQFRR